MSIILGKLCLPLLLRLPCLIHLVQGPNERMSLNKLCRLWSIRNFYDHSSLDHSGLKVLEIPSGPYSGLREAAHSLRPEPSACQVAPAQARLFGRLPPGLLVWPPRLQLAPPFPFTGETNTFRVRGIKPLYKTLVCRRKASHCFRERANHRAWLLKCFSKWNTRRWWSQEASTLGGPSLSKQEPASPPLITSWKLSFSPAAQGCFLWFTSRLGGSHPHGPHRGCMWPVTLTTSQIPRLWNEFWAGQASFVVLGLPWGLSGLDSSS